MRIMLVAALFFLSPLVSSAQAATATAASPHHHQRFAALRHVATEVGETAIAVVTAPFWMIARLEGIKC